MIQKQISMKPRSVKKTSQASTMAMKARYPERHEEHGIDTKSKARRNRCKGSALVITVTLSLHPHHANLSQQHEATSLLRFCNVFWGSNCTDRCKTLRKEKRRTAIFEEQTFRIKMRVKVDSWSEAILGAFSSLPLTFWRRMHQCKVLLQITEKAGKGNCNVAVIPIATLRSFPGPASSTQYSPCSIRWEVD